MPQTKTSSDTERLVRLSKPYATLSTRGSILLAGTQLSPVPAGPAERAYVLSHWMRGALKLNRLIKPRVTDAAFLQSYQEIAEAKWPLALVLKDAAAGGGACHGFIVVEPPGKPAQPPCLHYVYVPPDLRRLHVCSKLIELACGGQQPEVSLPWPFPTQLNYNPYRLR